MSKLVIVVLLVFISVNKSYCQNFYVALSSDTAKTSHTCSVYLGYKDSKKNIYTANINIPFTGFFPFKCDAVDSLYLTVDCIPSGFVIEKPFSCGDSIIINVDKRTIKYLNKK